MSGKNTPGGGGVGESASGRPSAAPHYIDPVLGNFSASKPKGKNLQEGGFDFDNAENASWTSEIGSQNDPGRRTETNFDARNVENPGQAGAPIAKTSGPGGGEGPRKGGQPYEALNSEEEA